VRTPGLAGSRARARGRDAAASEPRTRQRARAPPRSSRSRGRPSSSRCPRLVPGSQARWRPSGLPFRARRAAGAVCGRGSRARPDMPRSPVSSDSGTLTIKIQCQLISVKSPPSGAPAAAPTAPIASRPTSRCWPPGWESGSCSTRPSFERCWSPRSCRFSGAGTSGCPPCQHASWVPVRPSRPARRALPR
jgi:hypothetical protein